MGRVLQNGARAGRLIVALGALRYRADVIGLLEVVAALQAHVPVGNDQRESGTIGQSDHRLARQEVFQLFSPATGQNMHIKM